MELEGSALAQQVLARVSATRQGWETLQARGTQAATALANALVETSFTGDAANWGHLATNHALQRAVEGKMREQRRQLGERLCAVVDLMGDLSRDLDNEYLLLQRACDTLATASPEWGHARIPVSRTWTLFHFERALCRLTTMLRKDLCCKRDVMLDLQELSEKPFGSSTHDTLLLYLSVWSTEPYMDWDDWTTTEQALVGEIF